MSRIDSNKVFQREGETLTWTFTWDGDWSAYTGFLRVGTWGSKDLVASATITVVSSTVITTELTASMAPGRYHTQLRLTDGGDGTLLMPDGPDLIIEPAIS